MKNAIIGIIILVLIIGGFVFYKNNGSKTPADNVATTVIDDPNLDKEITAMLSKEEIVKSGFCKIDGSNINVSVTMSATVDVAKKIELVNKYTKIAKDKYKDKQVSVAVVPEGPAPAAPVAPAPATPAATPATGEVKTN